MRTLIPGFVLISVLAAGCGTTENTIKPEGAARSVVDVVTRQAGFRPTDVSCPSDVAAKVGGTFDCHFTGPEPMPYTAHVRITKVDGTKVNFVIRTYPTR